MRWPIANPIKTQGYRIGHRAIDMVTTKTPVRGQPVVAPTPGKVIATGKNALYIGGWYVIVRSSKGTHKEHYVGHLLKGSTIVKVGQTVKEGQKLARIGRTGFVIGKSAYHVHYQIREYNGGALLNPEKVYKPL